jgi:hypothetical protein
MADERRELLDGRPPSPPISVGRDAAARALRAFANVTAAATPSEERAWRAVEQRLETGATTTARLRRWLPSRAFAALAVGATVVALLVVHELPSRRPTPVASASSDEAVAPRPTAPQAANVADHPPTPRRASTPRPTHALALGAAARPLPVGAVELAGEAVVTVPGATTAAARAEPSRTVVRLTAGAATFDVVPGRGGRAFRVEAGDYAFEVLGTVFAVSREPNGRVSLRVHEGRVAVLRGRRRVAVVGEGGRWTARARAHVASARPVAAREVVDPMLRCGEDVAVGDNPAAIKCYEAVAGQKLPSSESALVMAAHLRADDGDAEGAVALLRSHADRFPEGELDDEVKLMLIELLPTIGWDKEALALSGSYLASEAGQQHRSEILVLRGHIYRRLGACASALGEYRAAAEGPRSPASDEGAFFHALCLQAVGRLADARRAYWEYLLRPGAARAGEARKRVDHLD